MICHLSFSWPFVLCFCMSCHLLFLGLYVFGLLRTWRSQLSTLVMSITSWSVGMSNEHSSLSKWRLSLSLSLTFPTENPNARGRHSGIQGSFHLLPPCEIVKRPWLATGSTEDQVDTGKPVSIEIPNHERESNDSNWLNFLEDLEEEEVIGWFGLNSGCHFDWNKIWAIDTTLMQ